MTLRSSLNDYKRTRGAERAFPGELRSTTGILCGDDDRLVHVDEDGSLRDYSYPLSGLAGIDRSRFGVDGVWFPASAAQRYVGDGTLVETIHDLEEYEVVQRDLTVGRAHVTRFTCRGDPSVTPTLQAYVEFAPDGHEGQASLLFHDHAVEAYHRREHDYLGVSTTFETVEGQIPERFDELLDDAPMQFPRDTQTDRYEDARLTGGAFVTAPFADGTITLVTLLAERSETGREAALSTVDRLGNDYTDGGALVHASDARDEWAVPASTPHREAVVADLRTLSLLSAADGGRIAGPEFDPFYAESGGYGYTWFRDDAEIARALLAGSAALGLDLDAWHQRSAAFYRRTQLPDGSWPHRVWPDDETLAPGWANARLESGDATNYQADQTASVVTFLAEYLRTGDPADPERFAQPIERAVESLDDTLGDDGLPEACQNLWENMDGRFVHTAATFLHAYAAVARAPVGTDCREHARSQAATVLGGLERLWTGEHYALRLHEGELDGRLDAGSLALPGALRATAAVTDLDDGTVDRLAAHVMVTLDGLERDSGAVRGLIRFEGDDWRRRQQSDEKIWTVSTAWGAHAAADLGALLAARDDHRAAAAFDRSRDLLTELLPGGSLPNGRGYLPEQVFDDGTADSATPLGWPHALRLGTIARLADHRQLAGTTAASEAPD